LAEDLHVSVLVAEVVDVMRGAEEVIDMTVGAGGHAEALLESGVGRVIGVDRDPDALAAAAERLARFRDRFTPVQARFSEVPRIVDEASLRAVEGTLFDLGVSSLHLDRPDRGFSYRTEGPLDMRMEPEGPTAADLVNRLPEEELARIIFQHGEERASRRIARAIVRAREREPIETTVQLARIVAAAAPGRRRGPHPARRTFQALRIAVNEEVEELTASLPQAVGLLASDGRIAAVSYHSIEDRIVKRAFLGDDRLEVLTKKPVRPSEGEMRRNRRARSAKLRAARRMA
jgi:16S rRNA (cytosine1402-N4)-methyltransferase